MICLFRNFYSIAADRYLLIVHSTTFQITYKCATRLIVGVWLLGGILASPLIVFTVLKNYTKICGEFCAEEWPTVHFQSSNETGVEYGESNIRRIYGLSVLFLQYGFPLVITAYCNLSNSPKIEIL